MTSLRGTEVVLYGNGLYRDDSLFFGAGFVAQDFVLLLLVTPILAGSVFWMWRRRLGVHLLNYAVLGFLVYAYGSLVFSAAYNTAFFAYTLLFGCVVFAMYFAHSAVVEHLEGAVFDRA